MSELLDDAIDSQIWWTFVEFKISKCRGDGAIGVSGWKERQCGGLVLIN